MMVGHIGFREGADIKKEIRRRNFLRGIAGAATAWPLGARAQSLAGKIQHIGIIDDSPSWEAFRQQLRELNYVEGRTLAYVYLSTDGSPNELYAAAMTLSELPVNVIAAFGTPRAKAAQRATKTIPIVAISIGDPIGSGLVTSLAHPAGNITGNTILGRDIVTKKLQILRDAIPTVTRIAYLWNPENSATADIFEDLRKAVPLFQMTLISLAARTTVDFDRVFAQMSSDRPDAVLLTSDPAHQAHMPEIIDFLLKNRIPGLFQAREHVVAGGLMSYGVSLSDLFRMGALYTDKILRGTKPGDLPIAQPVTFEFVINLKTAKAIGLEIPAMVIARADAVIE
jgi:putative tryptophan/tyrosine transport system substrate-binding protein